MTQTSRGKFDRLPRTTAGFTLCAFDGYGLRGHWPARPTLTPHIRFLFPSASLRTGSGSRGSGNASFRPHLTMTPLRFANPSPPSGRVEDLHLQAVEHARHTKLPRRKQRGIRTMQADDLRAVLDMFFPDSSRSSLSCSHYHACRPYLQNIRLSGIRHPKAASSLWGNGRISLVQTDSLSKSRSG